MQIIIFFESERITILMLGQGAKAGLTNVRWWSSYLLSTEDTASLISSGRAEAICQLKIGNSLKLQLEGNCYVN